MALTFIGVSAAFAQGTSDGGPDPAKVSVKIGPLWLNPSIALTNLGVDTNVFNVPANQNPQRDFTFTLTPQTDLWLRMGRTWVTSTIREDIVWYQTYASQRGLDDNYLLGWKVPLNRLSFSVKANWVDTRDRPGYEIDARAQRLETTYGGTAEVNVFSKTFFGVTGSWYSEKFNSGDVFLGVNLAESLNHTTTDGGVTVRHQLTPLTSLTFAVTRDEDRFDLSTVRNSNSTLVSGTVTFDPAALIKGSATIGVRSFQPLSADLPGFQGATAAVNLSYAIFGTTKFTGSVMRDVQYSFDVGQPYYLQTGGTLSISQQIFGPLDVVVRAGIQRLAYRDVVGAVLAVDNEIDHVYSYGGGFGYHFGKDARLGFNLDQVNRVSPNPSRQYNDLQFGTSLTYGS